MGEAHAEGEACDVAEDADDDALQKEDENDLGSCGADGFQDADLPRFQHGDRDEGVHDAEGCDDDDEHEQEHHGVPFDGDGVEDLCVLIDPREDPELFAEMIGDPQFEEIGVIGMWESNADPVNSVAEVVKFLCDVEGCEEDVRVVLESTGFEDAFDGQ